MTTNELKVLSIIWDWGGEASVDIIARETGISLDYARLLCECLKKEGCIDFLHSKLGRIKSKPPQPMYRCGGKGKIAVARKIVIPERPSRFGLGKDKRGRLLLNYG